MSRPQLEVAELILSANRVSTLRDGFVFSEEPSNKLWSRWY